MTRPTLIHIHIPKTAGTTLNLLLGDALGGHREFLCATPQDARRLAAEPQNERDKIDFILGHYEYGLHKYFTRPVLYMSCMREPRRRVLSFYRFILSQEDHPLHDAVQRNSRDFSSFLALASEDAGVRDSVDNVQVRMLGGDMGVHDEYENALGKALANITAPNFLVGEMDDLSSLLARLAGTIDLSFGSVPRLNASDGGPSFAEEMQRLGGDAQSILEHLVRWDTILYAVAKDTAGSSLTRTAPPRRSTTGRADSVVATPSGNREVVVGEVVQALYRVLLLREPDPTGFESYTNEIGNGLTIENAMRRILRSREFAQKHAEFMRTHLPAGMVSAR